MLLDNGKVVGYSGFAPDPDGGRRRGSNNAARCGGTFATVTAISLFMMAWRSSCGAPPNSESVHHFQTATICWRTSLSRRTLHWTLAA